MEARSEKEKSYEALKREIQSCRLCEERFGYEPRPIVWGNQHSRIMQISQAPSLNVHLTGKPFNDASGKTLRQEWYHITDEDFYNPDNFYIVSVAHCYPGKAPGGGDRLPPAVCARTWLCREAALVDNRIFLLVGRAAAQFFFPKRQVTELVFEDLTIEGKPAFVLPHPSPLNRKWLKDHPEFLGKRMPEIEAVIHKVLEIER